MEIEIDNSRYAHNVAFELYLFHVELFVHNGDTEIERKDQVLKIHLKKYKIYHYILWIEPNIQLNIHTMYYIYLICYHKYVKYTCNSYFVNL